MLVAGTHYKYLWDLKKGNKKFFWITRTSTAQWCSLPEGEMYFLTFWHKAQNTLNMTQLKKNFEYQFISEIVHPDTME